MAVNKPYMARGVVFMDFARGGWAQVHEILYEGKAIGGMRVERATRSAPIERTFCLGDACWPTFAEFKAAHQASLEASHAG